MSATGRIVIDLFTTLDGVAQSARAAPPGERDRQHQFCADAARGAPLRRVAHGVVLLRYAPQPGIPATGTMEA